MISKTLHTSLDMHKSYDGERRDEIRFIQLHFALCPCNEEICSMADGCEKCGGPLLSRSQFELSGLLTRMLEHRKEMPSQWTVNGELASLKLYSTIREWTIFLDFVCCDSMERFEYTPLQFADFFSLEPAPPLLHTVKNAWIRGMQTSLLSISTLITMMELYTIFVNPIIDPLLFDNFDTFVSLKYTKSLIALAWFALVQTGFTLDIFCDEQLSEYVKNNPESKVCKALRVFIMDVTNRAQAEST